MSINILKTNIFLNYKIIAGTTLINKQLYPPNGFSISKAEIYNDNDIHTMRQDFADFLNCKYEDLAFQTQLHSDIITIVDNSYSCAQSDAIITNIRGKILVASIADCGGILLYDPINGVVAAVHSGWRGSYQNIVGKTIAALANKFMTEPKNLLAYLAPSASVENYEIGGELLEMLGNYSIKRNEKIYFDNKKMITQQLLNAGVQAQNIEISNICTISDANYHSFRRDKKKSGRMATFIGMLE
ncbi:MAG TPA: peptidoglycan editing factor PgeF [Candidatus Kapabacteria bacterium]|nr:peptidoglycan editing factor PgeF [Candidatus Kapabacteria bacterium]